MPVGICPICGERRYLGYETGICFDCEYKQTKANEDEEIAEAVEKFLKEDEGGALAQLEERVVPRGAGSNPAGPTSKDKKEVTQEMSRKGICKECGREMSIKAYGLCGACYNKLKKENRLPSKTTSEKATLTISFEHYPDLLQALTQKAMEDFRPIEMEILWLLKQSLEREAA